MKLVVDNITTSVVIGGKDNLLDIDIMKELRKYLRARPKGYSQSKLYRSHKWDGWTYFITPKGKMATGFLPLVIPFLEGLGVEIEIEDKRKNVPKFQFEEFDNFIGRIDGKDWIAEGKFSYQVTASKSIERSIKYANGTKELYFPRGILDCATNAGKNSMSALIMNNVEEDAKVIFTTSSTIIYDQAIEFFRQVVGDDNLGQVKSGLFDPRKVTIVMVKSLLNKCEELNVRKWLDTISVLIVDESDEAGAKEYTTLLQYINAGMRVLISGTPLDNPDKSASMRCIGHAGNVTFKITNEDLIKLGVSQKPIVRIKYNSHGKEANGLASYDVEMDKYIHKSEFRMEQIAEIVRDHAEEQILITFKDVAHGHRIYQYLKHHTNCDVDIAHSNHLIYTCDRNEAIANFRVGKINVLVCSHIIKRGANINTIRVLIRAEAGKSKTDTKQVAGRATRHDGEHEDVLMYDFYDEGKYISKHSRDRIKFYRSEGFEVITEYEEYRNKPKV